MKPYFTPLVLFCIAFHAQIASADRKEEAAALFEQGIRHMEAGKIAEACKELEDSVATWPDSGAMGALAECDTALGKTASAWFLWTGLATTAPTAELREDATANAAKLEPYLARALIRLHGTIPADLELRVNGKRVRAQPTGEVPVDPGPLVIVVSTPESPPWIRTFRAVASTTTEIDVPLKDRSRADPGEAQRFRRLVGLSISGSGVAVLATGLVLGLVARSDWQHAVENCGGDTTRCERDGLMRALADNESAHSMARWSNITIGLGAAAIAAGVIVYVTAPAPEHPSTAWQIAPMAGPQILGLSLSGEL